MIPIIILFIVFALVFLFMSVYYEDLIFAFFSSILFSLIGIYIIINGLLSQINWFTRGLGILIVGVSFYIMILSSLNLIIEMGGDY